MPRPADAASATRSRRARPAAHVWVLSIGQVLGGLAFGATISLGARAGGRDLRRRGVRGARHRGHHARHGGLRRAARRVRAPPRAPALARGGHAAARWRASLLVILAAAVGSFPLLLVAFGLDRRRAGGQPADAIRRRRPRHRRDSRPRPLARRLGDDDRRRARPEPHRAGRGRSAQAIGMPPLTGPYLFTIVAQLLAIALYLIWLRPDPLLLAQRVATQRRARAGRTRSRSPIGRSSRATRSSRSPPRTA